MSRVCPKVCRRNTGISFLMIVSVSILLYINVFMQILQIRLPDVRNEHAQSISFNNSRPNATSKQVPIKIINYCPTVNQTKRVVNGTVSPLNKQIRTPKKLTNQSRSEIESKIRHHHKSFAKEFSYPMNVDFADINRKHNEHKVIDIVPINPHPYCYIHSVQNKCSSGRDWNGHKPAEYTSTLLVLVKSSVKNCRLRDLIRRTWGDTKHGTWTSNTSKKSHRVLNKTWTSHTSNKPQRVLNQTGTSNTSNNTHRVLNQTGTSKTSPKSHRVLNQTGTNIKSDTSHTAYRVVLVFLLGSDPDLQLYVDAEAAVHGDIVQEDFVDAYWNNTIKLVMGFNWALEFCTEAQFIMFVDDDFFVARRNVIDLLGGVDDQLLPNFITGYLLPGSTPYRDINSKWYISDDDYPFDRWPPYLGGGAFVLSMQMASKFQIAFPYVKAIHIDDTYLGIVAKKIGIKFIHNGKFCTNMRCTHLIQSRTAIAVHGSEGDKQLAEFVRQTH
jgi:hypothetical protein